MVVIDSTYTDMQWTYWGESSIISFDLQFLRVISYINLWVNETISLFEEESLPWDFAIELNLEQLSTYSILNYAFSLWLF